MYMALYTYLVAIAIAIPTVALRRLSMVAQVAPLQVLLLAMLTQHPRVATQLGQVWQRLLHSNMNVGCITIRLCGNLEGGLALDD
jgi:4-hydroxybenzoate polyprenyltransferase